MSSKLTIRRVGSRVPTVCLVGFLFFCITVGWLSLVGLPDSILRKVEQIAAEHGVPLKLEAIRLAPYQGLALKAEGIQIYSTPEESHPLLQAKSLTVAISAFRLLFKGEASVKYAELKRAQVSVPVSDSPGEHLNLDDILVSTTITSGGDIRINSAKLNLEGISLRVSGDIDNISTQQTGGSETAEKQASKLDIPTVLAQITPYTDKAYHIIRKQHWAPEEMPHLHAHLTISHDVFIKLDAEVPRYDYSIFQFRNAKADLAYKNKTLTINTLSFETIEPPSAASLQGAYDTQLRHLGFDFKSNAALVPMITELLGEEKAGVLKKLRHDKDKSPLIKLKGTVAFEPNFTLSNLILNGELEQHDLYVDDTRIDKMTLGFFYKDGNFNLNSLGLQFDDNHINLTATANEGEGQASLSANINVDDTLHLINKFTPTPLSIPDNIRHGKRVKLQASASLTTPNFTPGQTNWQEFTPNIRQLTIALEPDSLAIDDIQLDKPGLVLELHGLQQNENKIPTGADSVTVAFTAAELGVSSSLQAQNVDVQLKARNISYHDGALSVDQVELSPGKDIIASELTFGELIVKNSTFQLGMGDISYAADSLQLSTLQATAAAESLRHGELQAEQTKLELKNISGLNPLADKLSDIVNKANVYGHISSISYEGKPFGSLNLGLSLEEGQKGNAEVSFAVANDTEHKNSLRTDIDWTNLAAPILSNIRMELSPASCADILEHFKIDIPQLKLPEIVQATGEMAFDSQSGKPTRADFHINVPKLERIPVNIKSFNEQPVTIGLEADVTLSPAQDNYNYTAQLKVTHKNDSFSGQVNGTTAGRLSVTGNNTIRADIVDRLIDSETAHSIIRDFQFTDASRNIVTNIDVKVDYSSGLSVDSYCDVELRRVGYQLGVILDEANGEEKVRTDLGRNPYTLADYATCYVRSKVRYPEVEDAGKKPKDECVITIGNIFMRFDNSPWFARQKFDDLIADSNTLRKILSEHTNTSMTGDAVIIDVENSFVELVNIKGMVYPAYSLGMYYAPLQHFLADVVLPYPANVETQSCVFPIYSDCTRPMSGLIRAEVPKKAGFRFIGTTIPLERFSGFIRLTDDYVMLDHMNAACWDGVLNAAVKIDFSGDRTAFDGNIKATNMNLKQILASYGTEYSSALCNGTLRFHSPSPEVDDVQGYGEVSVVNGDLMGFTLFQPIASLVTDLPSNLSLFESAAKEQTEKHETGAISNIFSGTGRTITNIGNTARHIPGYNHLFAYDIQDAHAKFAISKGHLRAYDMEALGYNLNVKMKLDVDLNTTYIRGNLWPSITSVPTIVLSPLTFLSDFMIDVLIYGKIDNLEWKFGLDRRLGGSHPSASDKKSDNTKSAPRKGR